MPDEEEDDDEVEVGGGAYWIQLDPWGEAASPDAAPCAGDMVVAFTVLEPWWFSVCLLNERASQYDLPHPSALHSYGFLFLCVNMWPLLKGKVRETVTKKVNL